MNCEHVLPRLSAYMDGELEASLHRRMAEHLSRCRECREALEDFTGVDTVLRGLPRLSPSADFPHVVASQIPGAASIEPRRMLRRPAWKRLLDHCEKLFDLIEPESRAGTGSLDELNDIPACFIGHAYFKVLGLQG